MNDAIFSSPGEVLSEDERKVRQRRAWFGFFAMMFGNFMAILDIQIVASSLNEIQAGLSASSEELTWVQTSYLIAEVVAIPLSGYLSRLLSTRIYFVMSALGFTLASLACAFAWDINSMIVFRALQGFLGGGMIPTTAAALFTIFPPEKRTIPLVLVGLVTTLAPALGPTIGGYLTQGLSWHWLFLINLIPGLVMSYFVWVLVRIDEPDWTLLKTIDFQGLILMALFLGSLEYVLDEGPRHDWLADDTVRPLALVAVVAGLLFFWRVLTAAHPIVQLRAYKNRNFATGSMVAFIIGILLYGVVYLVPLYFGSVRGYNSLQIGHVMMVTGLSMFCSAPLAGRMQRYFDPRMMLAYGLSMIAVATYMNANLTSQSGFSEFIVPQILRGHGFIFCMLPMNALALGTLKPDELKDGSGLYNLMRNLGGALGLAIINTLFAQRNAFHWSYLSEQVSLSREPIRQAFNTGGYLISPELGDQGAQGATLAFLARAVAQQAAVRSFNDLFLMLSVLVACSLVLVLLVEKPKTLPGPENAAH